MDGDAADTVVLGRYTHSNKPSLVSRTSDVGGWKVIYSGSPNLPAALLRLFAVEANVHMYVGQEHVGDSVVAAGNSLMVHAQTAGTREVTLPVIAATVVDDAGTVICSTPCKSFDAKDMHAGETRLFLLA
jgi:hypothetical protein